MAHDRDTLAEDWVALWQSEMAAMAADRELRESWTGLLALWASAVGTALQMAPGWRGYDAAALRPANGAAGAAQPPGTAPATAASDLGGDEARRLYERIAELNLAFQHLSGSEGASPSDPERLKQAFETAARQDRDLVAGIAAYRRDPYFRSSDEPPVIWAEAETRLLDYGGDGPAVLFVPSLVNRAYILDLMPDASMLRFLAGQGVHPYLLDWGWPGETERKFTLTDYVAGRLERAIAKIPGPIVLAGYCMGGLLALAAALRQPEKIRALALLATPWDFQAASPAQAKSLSDTLPMLEPMMQFSGTLPIDALQTLFTMIDPFGVGEKFRSFAQADKSSTRARRFVAMEDWLADGVPLAAPVAREAIGGWYGGNHPAQGNWRIAGLAVEPARFEGPVFCAIPARDRLVPPESARPLGAAFKNATIIEPEAGHIGMIAGTNAKDALWQPFANWLHSLS